MGRSCSLKLSLSLDSCPSRLIEASNVLVKSLGEKRTGGDGPVGPVLIFWLAMAFVEDHGPNRVELRQGEQIDVRDNLVHEEVEVPGTFNARIDVVSGSDGEGFNPYEISVASLAEIAGILSPDEQICLMVE